MPTKEQQPTPRESTSAIREVFSVVVVVGLMGLLTYSFVRDQASMKHAETALIVDVKTTTTQRTELCGPVPKDGRPVIISMLYSDDKKEWIEEAAQSFSLVCPTIQVKLTAQGGVESANAILAGTERPMLWSPADELVVQYLDARWKKEMPYEKPLFDVKRTTSLAASPMVLLMWENRSQVINRIFETRPMEHGPWVDIVCASVPIQPKLEGMAIHDMVPGTWFDWYNPLLPPPPDPKAKPVKVAKQTKNVAPPVEDMQATYRAPFPRLEQIKSWGRVKIAHIAPTLSAAGLEPIYLMAYDYTYPPAKRPEEAKNARKAAAVDPAYRGRVFASQLDKPDFARAFAEEKQAFGKWLRRCEAGLEATPRSVRQLTDEFFNVGENRYDGVITYEHLAFKILNHLDENDDTMTMIEVVYPYPTIMNQHPVVTLRVDELSIEQKIATVKWTDYLRAIDMQKKAIEHGFRPVNRDLSIREYNSQANPFLLYRRYGVDFDQPIVEPPRLDGDAVIDMIRIWEDATGRH